ncbi:MAG: cytochrome c family protein [Aliishimia sp.]
MDTMTLTKAAGALCATMLVLLLGKWAAEELYHVGGHGHGSEQAYVIEVEEAETGGEAEAEVSLDELLASADLGKGSKIFRKCSSCHKLEAGENGIGPYLYGVVGRDKGAAEGFGYSETLATMEGDWTAANLDGFLTDPRGYAPGNKMSFNGLKKPQERADLIAYLDSLDD